MWLKRILPALVTLGILTGCGGHGFDGTWRVEVHSASGFLANAIRETDGTLREISKENTEIEKRGNDRYLIISNNVVSRAWLIVDDNTLTLKDPMSHQTLHRVK